MNAADIFTLDNHSEIHIGWAKPEEWRALVMMTWKVFMEFDAADYEAAGVKSFFEFISDADIHKAFLQGNYQVLVARDGDKIVGVASIRNQVHLSLLFVEGAYHHLGIGKRLIDILENYLSNELGEGEMTVNSSPYAVEFYRKCGFMALGAERVEKGIRFTPMKKYLR